MTSAISSSSSNSNTETKTTSNIKSNTTMSTHASSLPKKSIVVNDASQDIPIFLRKTYHMVDTCNPEICSWSEDGETFIVKHPKKFEQEIIPQFFKHSKFSSFVRQLNFYAFRKIKTNDSIRIDAALEAATANYWRFYHPKFQKGKPDWLQEIKRSSSTPRGSGTKKANGTMGANNNRKMTTPDGVDSSASIGKENIELKSEVTSLKERIEAMNKNIDLLTTMVQNVSIAQKMKTETVDTSPLVNENNKRAKTTKLQSNPTKGCVPDEISSRIALPDDALSMPLPPLPSFPLDSADNDARAPCSAVPPNIKSDMSVRESSMSSEFSALLPERDDILDVMDLATDTDSMMLGNNYSFSASSSTTNPNDANKNRPRAELMNRLSDALSLLPRDIQELIVDRLIEAITSPKDTQESAQVAGALQEIVETSTAAASSVPMSVPQSPRQSAACCDASAMTTDDDRSTAAASVVPASAAASPASKPVPNPSLPLAAATLAALLSQYGKEPQCTAAVVAATNTLIPVHV